ncbi:hypothetical protein OG968_28850 [Streptomyces althioticus]|uniref:hypothetical protein n=1 Tax=Streptomyces althioticus TaxID=83380 RepID=UPI003873CA62|nr:hypothetical protein OG968_28850 [Streptomyces althioticus]
MSRTALLAGTALLTATVLLPAPAHAEAVTGYTITVDTGTRGPAIDDTMYGELGYYGFFRFAEDIGASTRSRRTRWRS